MPKLPSPRRVAPPPGTILQGPRLDPRIVDLTGETLVDLLERAVARNPERDAFVLLHGPDDERWTYRQLGECSLRVAATLSRLGVGVGDRVVTWGPNEPWLVAAFFAIWRLGAIVVPLDLRMQEEVAERIGARAEPVLVLAAEAQVLGAGTLGVPVIRIGAAELDPEGPGPQTTDSPGDGGARPAPAPVTPDMPAEIVFTSGTTSDPKGVVLSHGQVIHNARVITQTGMGPHPERGLGIIPLSHMYGQMVPLFMGMVSGSTIVFLPALTPRTISEALRRERITAITAVPQLAQLLLDGVTAEATRRGKGDQLRRAQRLARYLPIRLRRRMFRSVHAGLGGHLDIITSGGAYLPPEVQGSWESMGVLMVQGYGGTECAAIAGHTRSSRRPGTAGRTLPGLEVRIAADGELLVRGPSVMSGYWRAPEATAEVLELDGWLHTGDAARVDEYAEIVILGRTRDRIALPNGMKVYPDDVELALRETGVIRDAVVLEASPGRIAAVLVPADHEATDQGLAGAVKQANSTLGVNQRIGQWRRWPEADLPRTHTLKVRREPVRAWFREQAATEASKETR
jgi:long-chain acyl-CoA synthetase